MLLAALQMRAVCGDVAANVERIAAAAYEAAAAGATLLVAPELATSGYGAGEAVWSTAETSDGPLLRQLQTIVQGTGVAIVAGFPERVGDAVYNSAAFVDAVGDPVVYRKSHLFGDYERSLFAAPPPMTVLFQHAGIRCGMLICYDVEFPENVRRLARAGAQAILVPTALPAGPAGQFISAHMIRTRAFENQVFVVYTNHCGVDDRFAYAGSSVIAGPDGSVLAHAGDSDESLMIAELDLSRVASTKADYDYLKDATAAISAPHSGMDTI